MAEMQPEKVTPENPMGKEPVIHVIPEEFYGAAGKAKIPKKKKVAAPPVGKPDPALPAGQKPFASAPVPKSSSKKWLLIPVLALVLLLLIAFGTWYVLRSPAEEQAEAPTVSIERPEAPSTPEPEPETEPEEPEVVPEPEPETEPEEPEVVPEPEPESEQTEEVAVTNDSDNDGLSDEEEALYGTNSESTDSDGDGFSDSVEVINLYNPAGFRPTRLLEAGLVRTFESEEGGYQILFPTEWTTTEQPGGEIVFANPQDEPIAVRIESNEEGQSVLDWYLTRYQGVSPAEVQQFFTKSGLEGVRSPDSLISVISGGDRIYIITYGIGLNETIKFRSTFNMMVNSFQLKP